MVLIGPNVICLSLRLFSCTFKQHGSIFTVPPTYNLQQSLIVHGTRGKLSMHDS